MPARRRLIIPDLLKQQITVVRGTANGTKKVLRPKTRCEPPVRTPLVRPPKWATSGHELSRYQPGLWPTGCLRTSRHTRPLCSGAKTCRWKLLWRAARRHPEAVDDHPVVGRLDAKVHQLEETGVSHVALVDVAGPFAGEIVSGASVRIAVLSQPQVVGQRTIGSVFGHCPLLHLRLPRVGRSEVALRGSRVAVSLRNVCRAYQAGDLAGDRRSVLFTSLAVWDGLLAIRS